MGQPVSEIFKIKWLLPATGNCTKASMVAFKGETFRKSLVPFINLVKER